MNIYVTYAIIFVLLLVFELLYFNIAEKFNIVDKPNKRSSHSTIVLRGGGIIFDTGLDWLTGCSWRLECSGCLLAIPCRADVGDWNVICG